MPLIWIGILVYLIPCDEVNYVWRYLSNVAMSPLGLDEFGEAPGGNSDNLGRDVAEGDYVQSVNWQNCSKIVKYHTRRMKEVTDMLVMCRFIEGME